MSKKVSPTLIGLFTLSGLLLGAAALLLFGAGKFFEKTSNILLYFDKSANGLLVGSEVRFGGIRIGRVTSIKVLIDQKQNRKIIPVVVELSEKDLRDVGSTSGASLDFVSEAGVKKAVADGLRARMKQQSLLTGQLYIEFDIVPDSPWFEYRAGHQAALPRRSHHRHRTRRTHLRRGRRAEEIQRARPRRHGQGHARMSSKPPTPSSPRST